MCQVEKRKKQYVLVKYMTQSQGMWKWGRTQVGLVSMQMILAKIPYLIPKWKCVLIPESALANIHAKFELRK